MRQRGNVSLIRLRTVYTCDVTWTGDAGDGNATGDIQDANGNSLASVNGGASGSSSNVRLGALAAGAVIKLDIDWIDVTEHAQATETVPECE